MGGTNHYNTTQSELLAYFSSTFLFLVSAELISTSTDVVNTSKIDIEWEWLFRHLYEVFFIETLYTINETDKLNILSLSLESQETINDIICTRRLSAQIDQTDSQFFRRVYMQELLVKLE